MSCRSLLMASSPSGVGAAAAAPLPVGETGGSKGMGARLGEGSLGLQERSEAKRGRSGKPRRAADEGREPFPREGQRPLAITKQKEDRPKGPPLACATDRHLKGRDPSQRSTEGAREALHRRAPRAQSRREAHNLDACLCGLVLIASAR
jgi:hypothetical protein